MLYVGLTGNIASGKTEAADRFAALGATIIDADVLARVAVQPGSPGLERVKARWGAEIVDAAGNLDRARLRHLVFADRDELEALNAIIHPDVTRLRRARVQEARQRGDAVVIYVAPLLFERHLAREFDAIVLVDAPKALRFSRLVTKRRTDPEDAANMIAAQMPAELKRARADYVIENDGSLDELQEQVESVWRRLTARERRSSLAV